MGKCFNCGNHGRFYLNPPKGYADWQEWANRMSKTHEQLPCPNCGRLTIWRKKDRKRKG